MSFHIVYEQIEATRLPCDSKVECRRILENLYGESWPLELCEYDIPKIEGAMAAHKDEFWGHLIDLLNREDNIRLNLRY